MSYHTSVWDKIDIFSYHEPGKNRLKAKIHIFYQSSHTLENMLFLLILGPGIQWCRPFLRATNIFEEKFKMAAKRVVFLIRKGLTLIWEPFQSEIVFLIVRPTKWVCIIICFLEHSKMAAKIVYFFNFKSFLFFFLFIRESSSSQMSMDIAKSTKKMHGWCVTFEEKKSRWPPKRADFGSFSLWKEFYNHPRAHFCHRRPSVWQDPQDLFINTFWEIFKMGSPNSKEIYFNLIAFFQSDIVIVIVRPTKWIGRIIYILKKIQEGWQNSLFGVVLCS